MVSVSCARTRRRASGKLRPGGKSPCLALGGGSSLDHRIAPDQADQGEMPVQAGPTAALIVAQAQLLLAILVESLDCPAAMRQPRLIRYGAPVQSPREVPFRLACLPRQRLFPEQPARGASMV